MSTQNPLFVTHKINLWRTKKKSNDKIIEQVMEHVLFELHVKFLIFIQHITQNLMINI